MADSKEKLDKKSVVAVKDEDAKLVNWSEDQKRAFLDTMKKRQSRCYDAVKDNYTAGEEDLEFLDGNQWDEAEIKRRRQRGRPCLTDNRLPTFVDQVVGDERQNRPKAQVKPIDSRADLKLARIREGIIWNVEYLSNAEMIYDYACEMQVSAGLGAWRILTRYTEENPFIQEIYLERILNPFMVFMDPDAKDPVYADAKYGFIMEKMLIEDFKEKYPHQTSTTSFEYTSAGDSKGWIDSEYITLAEYFIRKPVTKEFCLLDDGSVLPKEDADKLIKEWEENYKEISDAILARASAVPLAPDSTSDSTTPQDHASGTMLQPGSDSPTNPGSSPGSTPSAMPPLGMTPPMPGASAEGPAPAPVPAPQDPLFQALESIPKKPTILQTKEAPTYQIKHYICTGVEILKESDFPGKYIPIILVLGKERNVKGKKKVRGLVRNAKDPQRILNYWTTSTAETVALAPKVPWLGTEKMFEGYENDYATAHIENFPYLKFNPDPRMPNAFPQRQFPGNPPIALFTEIDKAQESIKHAVGMFNADVGDVGPERSGLAVMQRQKPGDVGTFSFIDNLSRSVSHSCRVINEMIPYIYDTERDVRIRNIDDSETFVPINTSAENALTKIKANPARYDKLSAKELQDMITQAGEFGGKAKYNDITVGKYDVVVKVGPSYATQRDMAAQNLISLTQAQPNIAAVAGDILVKSMDFIGSEELSERLRKTLPPGLVELRPGEEPPEPPPPSPEQQVMSLKVEVEKMKIEAEKARIEVEQFKRTIEKEKLDVQEVRLQTEKIRAINQLHETDANSRQLVLNLIAEVMGISPAQKQLEAAKASALIAQAEHMQSQAELTRAMNPNSPGSGIMFPEPEEPESSASE